MKRSSGASISSPASLAAAVTVTVTSVGLLLGGCSAPWSSSPTDDFVEALNDADWSTAASHTDDPEAAETYLEELEGNIGDTTFSLETGDEGDGGDGTATTVTWTVPSGDEVTSDGTLSTGDDDAVAWDPTILSTELTPDSSVTYSDDRTYDLPVLDRRNEEQLSWNDVTAFTAATTPELDPEGQASAIAEAVQPVMPDFDTEDAAAQIAEAGEEGTALLSLRADDAAKVSEALTAVPGVDSREEGRLLSDPDTASPLDGGLREFWEQRLDDTAGWSLSTTGTENSDPVVLGDQAPEESDPIRTTMDLGAQSAAQRAVDSEDNPASIVAMSASTGGILAASQNDAANAQGTPALTGQFPPGSTFKTVTTSAALARGTVTPDEEVECPASVEVDGRVIPNDEDFDLGTVPMHTAFAESCNTTQALISRDLEPADLKNTAAQLGLGVDFEAPGMTSVTGSVPETDQGAARVESAIGQGEVLASPFGLALMEASVANGGQMVTPTLVQGEKTEADQSPDPMDPQVVESLRSMMRETVESGSASSLSDIDGLGGKTGTAEVDDNTAHGWFVGVVGDIAFCAFIEGADSSGPAVEMAGNFLRDDAVTDLRPE
ncbi:MAG TPA: penicillin-binding protein [Candidatus Corynebacterium avicola]|uniref:Penicillin-binding protein n=1 Tax=Candidatus Corynebacterium avicola TaxID=2838527 RepID=A0A9D1ULM9_9CORY|nr:penicillin-binding protein [Candidatus Corynebacterium avicola]